jgi:hypothetical protein
MKSRWLIVGVGLLFTLTLQGNSLAKNHEVEGQRCNDTSPGFEIVASSTTQENARADQGQEKAKPGGGSLPPIKQGKPGGDSCPCECRVDNQAKRCWWAVPSSCSSCVQQGTCGPYPNC